MVYFLVILNTLLIKLYNVVKKSNYSIKINYKLKKSLKVGYMII